MNRGKLFGNRGQRQSLCSLDRCSRDAQDLLLSWLDDMPARCAFLGTSNRDLDSLSERLQTRFQHLHIPGPDTGELSAFLARKHGLPADVSLTIAETSRGCVRAAELDAESWLDFQGLGG